MSRDSHQDRLRQLAVLVSSVDADAARQLLMHLPTQTVKQVRAAAATLGNISEQERQNVLQAFQKSATKSDTASPAPAQPQRAQATTIQRDSDPAAAHDEGAMPDHSSVELPPQSSSSEEQDSDIGGAKWKRLSIPALCHFASSERPAVIAVIVSQLPPTVAAALLEQLPEETSREVLLRLQRLQEVDAESMAAIDDYLTHRLSEYHHRVESASENERRLSAILNAAPAELGAKWRRMIDSSSANVSASVQASRHEATHADMPAADQPDPAPPPPSVAELYGDAVIDTTDLNAVAPAVASQRQLGRALQATTTAEPTANSIGPTDEDPQILPFAGHNGPQTQQARHNSIEIDFEGILHCSPQILAAVLSSADTETVLLALAGATPTFMKRFYGMLREGDAEALQQRLQQLGTIRLRDIDAAQQRLLNILHQVQPVVKSTPAAQAAA